MLVIFGERERDSIIHKNWEKIYKKLFYDRK